MTEEIWKDITGYEGLYKVSNLGRVKSLRNNMILKPGGERYLQVVLVNNKKKKYFYVHRLVATAFIKNVNNLPCINHIDENPNNNYVKNLEWCTREYNNNYGKRTEKTMKKVIQIVGKNIIEYSSIKEASAKTGINYGNICQCCKGTRIHAGGYIWKYKNNY